MSKKNILVWDSTDKENFEWNDWKYWYYIENTKDQFSEERLVALITKEPGILTTPDQYGMALDNNGMLWVVYRNNNGVIMLATSNTTYDDWLVNNQVLFVPSGSTNPTVVFDNQGRYTIAVEFLPAGSDQKEIWLYEPPYSGAGIRQVAQGQYPVLAKDVHGEIFLFYQAVDGDQILYRKSSEAFAVKHGFETSNNELLPRGFRIYHKEVSPYHDIYKHLMFYQANGEGLPRYKMSSPIDFYTVGLDLYITDSQGRGISGVRVEIGGQSHATDESGLVTFYKLPYNTNIEIKLSHPFLGLGDTQNIFIPESAKGTHVTHSLFFTKSKIKENLGVQTGLTGIKWQGTIFEREHLVEKLSPHINLGIEWESMLIPAYVLVYSGMEVVGIHETDEIFDTSLLTGSAYTETYNIVEFLSDSILTSIYIKTNAAGTYRVRIQNEGGTVTHHDVSLSDCPAQSMVEFELPEQLSITAGSRYRVLVNRPSSTTYAEGNGYEGNLWRNITGAFGGTVFAGWVNAMGFGFIAEEYGYKVVPGATVQLGDQISQTNQEGLAPFQDLQGGSLQDYEITHPDYPKVSKGTVLIPEGEFDFIPLKIYEKPWDGYALEEVKVHADLDIDWVAIDTKYRQPKETVSVSAGLTSILWVEVTE